MMAFGSGEIIQRHRRTIYSAVWWLEVIHNRVKSTIIYYIPTVAHVFVLCSGRCQREIARVKTRKEGIRKKGRRPAMKTAPLVSSHRLLSLPYIFSFHRRGSAHLFSSFYPLSERPSSSSISGRVLRNNRWVESSASKRAERVDDFGRRSSPQPSTQFKRLSSRLFELSLQFTSTTDDEQVNQPHSNRLLRVWI